MAITKFEEMIEERVSFIIYLYLPFCYWSLVELFMLQKKQRNAVKTLNSGYNLGKSSK